jgi:hypothetical protein
MIGVLIQVSNTVAWMCRSSFNKKWHFIHWNISNFSLLLSLPLLGCKTQAQLFMVSLDFVSVTAQLGIFAYFMALTPLHAIVVIFSFVVI